MFILLLLAISDQLTKYFFQQHPHTIEVIPHIIILFPVWNKGLSWGFLPQLMNNLYGYWAMTLFSIFSLTTLFYYYLTEQKKFSHKEYWFLVFCLAGGIGNSIDRIFLGAVCDFIHCAYGPYHFPAFNCADIYLSMAGLLAVFLFIERTKIIQEITE
jgi:signal peptidase II